MIKVTKVLKRAPNANTPLAESPYIALKTTLFKLVRHQKAIVLSASGKQNLIKLKFALFHLNIWGIVLYNLQEKNRNNDCPKNPIDAEI